VGHDAHHAKVVKVGGHVNLAAGKAHGSSSGVWSSKWAGVRPIGGEAGDAGKSEGVGPGRGLVGGGGGGSSGSTSVRERIAAMQKNMQQK
jgi:hypothetical protein